MTKIDTTPRILQLELELDSKECKLAFREPVADELDKFQTLGAAIQQAKTTTEAFQMMMNMLNEYYVADKSDTKLDSTLTAKVPIRVVTAILAAFRQFAIGGELEKADSSTQSSQATGAKQA